MGSFTKEIENKHQTSATGRKEDAQQYPKE